MGSSELLTSQGFADQEPGTLKKGPWTSTEDAILVDYVQKHGEGNWNAVQKQSGLSRCGKSCRLRWANHLRPNLKKGAFTPDEERFIIELHKKLGNKWAKMAAQLPGRTDNEIKNYWNTRIKRQQRAGLPVYPSETSTHASNNTQHCYENGVQQKKSDLVSSSNTQFQNLNLVNVGGSCHLRLNTVSSFASLGCELPFNSMVNQGIISLHNAGSATPGQGSPIQHTKRERDGQTSSLFGGITSIDQFADENIRRLQPYLQDRMTSMGDSVRLPPLGFPFEPDIPHLGLPKFNHPSSAATHSFVNVPQPSFRPESSQRLKLELPSSQSAESVSGSGTPQSAATSPYTIAAALPNQLISEPERIGSHDNSLLETLLLQEAQQIEGLEPLRSELVDQLLMLTSNSSQIEAAPVIASTEKNQWEDGDPTTRLGGRALSMFSEEVPTHCAGQWHLPCTLAHQSMGPGVKLEVGTSTQMLTATTYTDEELTMLLEFGKPDAATVPEWYNPHSADYMAAEEAPGSVDPEIQFQDCAVDLEQLISGQVVMSQVWELGSCQWNNMPGACQIGDLAVDCRAVTPIAGDQYSDSCAIY